MARIHVLGAGTPTPTPTRFGSSYVVEVGDDQVTVDGNHPLAGQILNFEVKVVEVRDATQEELDHGHVHGPGGHHH